jgi:hypothetical protein
MRGPWPKGVGFYGSLGALLVILGSFLPWLSSSGSSVSAWGIPLVALIPGGSVRSGGLAIGPLLLASVIVLLPYAIGRPLPVAVRVVLAALATNFGGLVLMLGLHASPAIFPGIGLLLALAGGVLILVGPAGAQRTEQLGGTQDG